MQYVMIGRWVVSKFSANTSSGKMDFEIAGQKMEAFNCEKLLR